MSDEPTLARLAHRVLQPCFEGTEAPDWVRRRLADGLGSVLLFARNIQGPEQTAALTAALHAENPEVVIAADEEGGDVTRLDAASGSVYPGNLALGAVDDVQLTEQVASSLGRRLAAVGIGLDYAPDADVNSNPDNPVIGVRSFGADTALVARHTAAWVRGLQQAGVGACAKHFPGHGDTGVDSHFALPTVRMSEEELAAVALPPFRAAIEAGVSAVMPGHLLIPSLDPDAPASVSRAALHGLLRGELGFRGLIATDAMEMRAVADRYGLERAVVLAVAAGADLVCIGNAGGDELVARLRRALVEAVKAGELAEDRLAEAADGVGRFVAWSAQAGRPTPEGKAGLYGSAVEIGLAAARRALDVRELIPGALPLRGAAHVVAFTAAGPAALGTVGETSLGAQLAAREPATSRATLGEASEAATAKVLAEAEGRPLVLAVRSAHRHPWMRAALDRLLEQRPDAVVAEMGLPGTGPLGAAYLVAYGASRACAAAVAERLTAS
ncbi:MAG TPA: glycoside hydrolase family 3 N-terminal domain-containing protein [Actinocrinis sp.]|jgi:beta-N-acetylhexosaminidase